MSLLFLLNSVLPFLPLIVVMMVVGVLVSFAHRFVLALLGRPQPAASGPVTPVGRFVGQTLSAVLAPIQQMLAIVAMFLVLSAAFFVADHFRLYDDGLVDTTATIIGRTKRCLDLGADQNAALPTAPACGDTVPTGRRVIDAFDVTFVGVGGATMTTSAPLYLARPGHTAPGDTFEAAYHPSEPLRLGHHISEMLTIGPEKLLLTGLVLWALSTMVKRVRRALAGRPPEDEGVFDSLGRLFRRWREGAADGRPVDLAQPDVGIVAARSSLGETRPSPTSGGFVRRTGFADRG